MAIRYRDTDGRFISARSAAHITTREIDSERYDEQGKFVVASPGYVLTQTDFQKTTAARAVELGVDPDFAFDAAQNTPELTPQDIAGEFFEGLPLEDFMDFDLDEEFEMDEDIYFES